MKNFHEWLAQEAILQIRGRKFGVSQIDPGLAHLKEAEKELTFGNVSAARDHLQSALSAYPADHPKRNTIQLLLNKMEENKEKDKISPDFKFYLQGMQYLK